MNLALSVMLVVYSIRGSALSEVSGGNRTHYKDLLKGCCRASVHQGFLGNLPIEASLASLGSDKNSNGIVTLAVPSRTRRSRVVDDPITSNKGSRKGLRYDSNRTYHILSLLLCQHLRQPFLSILGKTECRHPPIERFRSTSFHTAKWPVNTLEEFIPNAILPLTFCAILCFPSVMYNEIVSLSLHFVTYTFKL